MLLFLLAACGHHIPEPTGALAPLPAPASSLAVCRAEFATGTLPKGMVVAHGALKVDVPSTQSGLVLLHPDGAWLVDGGMAVGFETSMREVKGLVGFAMREASKGWTRAGTPEEVLGRAGLAPAMLKGAILSHGHFDHLGGLLDLPAVPIWAPAQELEEASAVAAGGKGSILPAEARALVERGRAISFDGPAVGPYPASWDLYGDGSAVIVPMPGHTAGSVGTLLRLPDGRRVFHVGDTVWVREGYEAREPKGWLASSFDSSREGTDEQIQRLWQLHQADPELIILPAHDRRQWEALFGAGDCIR
ncbi:MAG: MBL fold metallo-hydrolase [Pseudomonadota bacterium]|nr:MBL fold metallo-hydrolase [Pseudomonadota bacterium]